MWLQIKLSLFGREICSLEVDKAIEDGFIFDEEECEDEEDDSTAFRWGEPACFERDIYVPGI